MMLLIDQYGDLPSVVFFLGRVMVFPIFRSHQNHIKKCSQRRTQTFHRILWLDPGPRLPKRGKQALWLNDVASTLQSYLESLSHEIYNSKSSIMLFWIKLDPKISISTTFWTNCSFLNQQRPIKRGPSIFSPAKMLRVCVEYVHNYILNKIYPCKSPMFSEFGG